MSLEVLDLFGIFGSQSLFIINLGRDRGNFLVLPLHCSNEFRLDSFQVRNCLLGELKVTISFPLEFLNISLCLLFPFQTIFTFIKSLFKLTLDFVEMIAFVLHGLDVFLSLLTSLSNSTLLLLELSNHILLVSNFLLQGSDLVVLGHFVFLSSFQSGFKSLDISCQFISVSLNLCGLSLQTGNLVLFSPNSSLSLIHLLLEIILLSLNPVGFVNDVLDSRATTLKSKNQFILFSTDLLIHSLDFVAFSNGLVNIGFSNGNLLFILSLVLSKLGTFEVRLDGQPQLPPKPSLTNVVVTNGSLEAVESQLLILQLLEDETRGFSSGLGLQPRQDRANSVFTNLFHETKDTSTEEDFGVSKTELLRVQCNGLHDCSSSILVLLCLGNCSSSQDVVTLLEFRVENLVGESSSANSNTSQHTVTLVLMHDKTRLNTSGDLVSVGDNTTDEGRISSIQGLHQVIKLGFVEK